MAQWTILCHLKQTEVAHAAGWDPDKNKDGTNVHDKTQQYTNKKTFGKLYCHTSHTRHQATTLDHDHIKVTPLKHQSLSESWWNWWKPTEDEPCECFKHSTYNHLHLCVLVGWQSVYILANLRHEKSCCFGYRNWQNYNLDLHI